MDVMSEDTNNLRNLYLDVVGDATLKEPQEVGPSREPIGEAETAFQETVSAIVRKGELTDAVE